MGFGGLCRERDFLFRGYLPKILCFVCAMGGGLRHKAKPIGFKMVFGYFSKVARLIVGVKEMTNQCHKNTKQNQISSDKQPL